MIKNQQNHPAVYQLGRLELLQFMHVEWQSDAKGCPGEGGSEGWQGCEILVNELCAHACEFNTGKIYGNVDMNSA